MHIDCRSDHEEEFLNTCLEIYRTNMGFITPGHYLVCGLVNIVERSSTLTPERIAGPVAEFEDSYRAMEEAIAVWNGGDAREESADQDESR